jgi:uncharacterized membrane protein YphA (DoxX/SURF4 family)
MNKGRLVSAWWTLKIALGLLIFLTGLDKFFGLLTNWADYLNPALAGGSIPPDLLMKGAGVLEMLLGFAILTRWTKLGSYVVAVWFVAIAASLVTTGKLYDVAVDYVALSLVAFTLGRLTEVRDPERVSTDAHRAVRSEEGFLRLNL